MKNTSTKYFCFKFSACYDVSDNQIDQYRSVHFILLVFSKREEKIREKLQNLKIELY